MRTKATDGMQAAAAPPVMVTVAQGENASVRLLFDQAFRIGRDPSCEVQISHQKTSRKHAEVYFEDDRWWIRDLQSKNGTILDGRTINQAALPERAKIQLGADGAILLLEITSLEQDGATVLLDPTAGIESPPSVEADRSPHAKHPEDESLSRIIHRYFEDSDEGGEHTQMVRRAFKHVEKKQKKKYTGIIAVLAVLGFCATAYGLYRAVLYYDQQERIRAQEARIAALETQARDIFYQMKQLELTAGASPEVNQLKQQYAAFVDELGVYDHLSEEDRLIYRMARLFGECDVEVPEEFVRKVREYIGYWQATDRFEEAVERAQTNGYTYPIVETFLRNNLPPQFFYLALQESDFNPNVVGPPTAYGHAKGMWQFIQLTATRYGLQTGPLTDLGRPDPLDDRHDFQKSTAAAARYIRDIYETDAKASGLLVMASYNWGESNVLHFIRRLPENPRERNFWRLLEQYDDRIPQETYQYVFYIFSASVIGENPRLFGFDFDNPLAGAIQAAETSGL